MFTFKISYWQNCYRTDVYVCQNFQSLHNLFTFWVGKGNSTLNQVLYFEIVSLAGDGLHFAYNNDKYHLYPNGDKTKIYLDIGDITHLGNYFPKYPKN